MNIVHNFTPEITGCQAFFTLSPACILHFYTAGTYNFRMSGRFKYLTLQMPILVLYFGLIICQNIHSRGAAMPEKKFIALPNGENYAYIEQGEEKKASGNTILLIHGNASSSLHFLPLFRNMNDVHLVAPDIRGFGDSSYKNGFSTLLELAEDIKMFAQALGITRAHVVGWSTGGGIALEMAVKYPEFVSTLFLIQGAGHKGFPLFSKKPDGTYAPFASKEELANDPILIKPALAAHESKNTMFFKISWDAVIYVNKKPSMKDNKIYIGETLKQRNLVDLDWALIHFNLSDQHNGYSQGTGTIGNISCPAAFTCAELDKIVPPATVRENAAAVKGSRLLEYKKSGHSPLVDCPDQVAADLRSHAGIVR